MNSGTVVNQLLGTSNKEARDKAYAQLADDYGRGFADSVRDTVEAHHLIVGNERLADRA
jgi:hypothetical protein